MGILLAVLGFLAVYWAAVVFTARHRALRGASPVWFWVMLLLPVWSFPLGFLSPPLWFFVQIGALAYAGASAAKELKIRLEFLERVGGRA